MGSVFMIVTLATGVVFPPNFPYSDMETCLRDAKEMERSADIKSAMCVYRDALRSVKHYVPPKP